MLNRDNILCKLLIFVATLIVGTWSLQTQISQEITSSVTNGHYTQRVQRYPAHEDYAERISHVSDVNFRALCQQLQQGTSVDMIQATKLAYLTLNAASTENEAYFVEEILPLWWAALKPKLREVLISDLIKGTLTGWRMINKRLGDDRLLKKLSDDVMMHVIYYVHLRLQHLSPRNFYYFLSSLTSFDPYLGKELKTKLVEKVSKIFPQYLTAAYNNKVVYSDRLLDNIGLISFELKEFGLPRPDEATVKVMVAVYSHLLNANVPCSGRKVSFDYFMTVDRVAVVLMHWNIDADRYEEKFWAKWYDRSFEFYRILRDSYDVFRVLYLLHCLQVCLRFDQEQEFVKLVDFWLQEFVICKHLLRPEQNPLEELKKKYKCGAHLSEKNGLNKRTFEKIVELCSSTNS